MRIFFLYIKSDLTFVLSSVTVRPQGGECFLRAVPGKPNTYYNVASGSTHSCPSGTVFNERDCVCENSFTLTHIQKQTSALVKGIEMQCIVDISLVL